MAARRRIERPPRVAAVAQLLLTRVASASAAAAAARVRAHVPVLSRQPARQRQGSLRYPPRLLRLSTAASLARSARDSRLRCSSIEHDRRRAASRLQRQRVVANLLIA